MPVRHRAGTPSNVTPWNLSRVCDSGWGSELDRAGGTVPVEMGSGLEDAELVRRIRGGETTLFEIVMHRYGERLFNVARAVLRDEAEAEDVLQEAYVRAYEHLSELRDPARLG